MLKISSQSLLIICFCPQPLQVSQKEVLQTSRTASATSPISESQAWPMESI